MGKKRFVYRYPIPETELDPKGNWHSPYFYFAFIRARIALFESFGVTAERLEQEGLHLRGAHVSYDHFLPLGRGDTALILITPTRLGRSSMTFSYEVYEENDLAKSLHASGDTIQILVNNAARRSAELPSWIRLPLEAYL